MVDNLSLLVSHGLLIIAAWRLLAMPALDQEPSARPEPARQPPEPESGHGRA